MYIKREEEKEIEGEKKPEHFTSSLAGKSNSQQLLLEEHEDFMISRHSRDVLAHWRAPEFETFERDRKWYMVITGLLIAIVVWALYTNSPIMAITFILIGALGYVYINKKPRELDFMVTCDGVQAGREFYAFDDLKSFWIFYEPEGKKVISLHTQSHLVPFVHIPIHEEDPARIREILAEYLLEEKHQEGLAEMLERLLRI